MKTEFTSSNKDNVAIATILAAGLFVLTTGLFNSNATVANPNPSHSAKHNADAVVQTMGAIVVTAPRLPVVKLDTMVVTASRITQA